ncbi:hypothetical protein K4C27_004458 [Escherichia coli]|uniref:hypothetical protein n=1 Tax=Escherichia TaxID=561 RepID=UPI0015D7CEC9|nr:MULTISPECIES: hypothetical protein [Escherichia]EHY3137779.1 hypothetical protein [Escherichia coli]EJK6492517.1 hypothetical protein [Escherichia coli]MBA7740720.1 hypothetical protein [Escherichia marmotae]MBA7955368.1 hypothetical protein [Escherichia marmotae]MCI5377110.1 hypothetical protein [Escherichia coli]
MKKTISVFFHRLGVIFSIFIFAAFWFFMASNLTDVDWQVVLVLCSSCVFVYGTARFIGWVINGLIKN